MSQAGDVCVYDANRVFIFLSTSAHNSMHVGSDGLSPQQVEFQKVAKDFADREMLPHAAKWDEEEYFPLDTLREYVSHCCTNRARLSCFRLAKLGFAGIYCKEQYGGTGLGRIVRLGSCCSLFAAVIFSSASFVHIDRN